MSKTDPLVVDELDGKETASIERRRAEQRRHPRLSTNLEVQVCWIDAFGFQNEGTAVVKNISAGGFGIEFGHNRPLGSRLTVRTGTNSIQCLVRHTQPRQGDVYLGLEVLPTLEEAGASQSLDRLGTVLSDEGDH